MTLTTTIILLIPPTGFVIFVSLYLLRKALVRRERLPEDIALALAWVFVVGGLVWLGVFLSGSTLFGFGAPWTWLAAMHFFFAGFLGDKTEKKSSRFRARSCVFAPLSFFAQRGTEFFERAPRARNLPSLLPRPALFPKNELAQ